MIKKLWYLWANALGAKAHDDELISDRIAVIRSLIVFCYITTNIFIIASIIHHW